jgi:uncharacterized Zn finger protein
MRLVLPALVLSLSAIMRVSIHFAVRVFSTMQFTRETIRSSFDAATFARGASYARDGKVIDLSGRETAVGESER